jgi:septal ring factor EnvC (AmiA/AmiB activator)
MKAKRNLIDRVKAILDSEDWQSQTETIIAIQKEWKTIGSVPRRFSDELWQQFTPLCDYFFNRKREADRQSRSDRRGAREERTMQSGDRNKLLRLYDTLTQEIKTAENNILFFTGKSKTANQLVDSMQKKIEALKKQLTELEKKINAIDNADNKQTADENVAEKAVEETPAVEKTEEKAAGKTTEKEVAETAEE